MKVDYAPRAVADAEHILVFYRQAAGHRVASAFEMRLKEVVERISRNPEGLPQLGQRRMVRVALLRRFPYKVFFRVADDRVTILHIRHTSRRPWQGEESQAGT